MTRDQALSEPESETEFCSNEVSYASWHAATLYVSPAWHESSLPRQSDTLGAHSAEHQDRSPMASLPSLDLFTIVELRWPYEVVWNLPHLR